MDFFTSFFVFLNVFLENSFFTNSFETTTIEKTIIAKKTVPEFKNNKVKNINITEKTESNKQEIHTKNEENNNSEKFIALTFDDGPKKYTTDKILKILSKENIPATFFVLGTQVEKNPELIKKIIDNNHEIGNHSWSHNNFLQLNNGEILEEMTKTENLIRDILKNKFSRKNKLARIPYGHNDHRILEILKNYKIINWSIDPKDWRTDTTKEMIINNILSNSKNGEIILLHDIYQKTVETLPVIIRELKHRGFKFLTVSEILKKDPDWYNKNRDFSWKGLNYKIKGNNQSIIGKPVPKTSEKPKNKGKKSRISDLYHIVE